MFKLSITRCNRHPTKTWLAVCFNIETGKTRTRRFATSEEANAQLQVWAKVPDDIGIGRTRREVVAVDSGQSQMSAAARYVIKEKKLGYWMTRDNEGNYVILDHNDVVETFNFTDREQALVKLNQLKKSR